jgi:RHH-type proline utilization regulon transcriptional repressor/proline dehydrogenase/delta 1-pyrroline-5-carboxylate dehydrogenase
MERILALAKSTDEAELGALAVELAGEILAAARRAEDESDRLQARTIASLTASPQRQRLVLGVTDRAQRSQRPARTVAAVREVVRRVGVGQAWPFSDRLQLSALSSLGGVLPALTAQLLKSRLRRESAPFVLDAAEPALTARLRELHARGLAVNLNQLGEEVLGEADAARYLATSRGLLARPDVDAVSVKLSSVCSQIRLLAFDHVVELARARLLLVCQEAAVQRKLVYFDMEAYRDLELTLAVFQRLCSDPSLDELVLGLALQAYLPDTAGVLERLLSLGKERAARGASKLRIRLVKGANLAAETVVASAHRHAVPVYPSKHLVDANYKRLLSRVLDPAHAGLIELGVGSHNLFDQAYAVVLAERRGVRAMMQLEMLEGMSRSTALVLARLLGSVLVYAPAVHAAQFPAAVAYLVRRLDENTSPENFLSRSVGMQPGDQAFRAEAARFTRALEEAAQPSVATYRLQDRSRPPDLTLRQEPWTAFDNAPDTDFTRAGNRQVFLRALDQAQSSQHEVRLSIAGHDASGQTKMGFDPSRPGHPAYALHWASEAQLETALSAAERAAPLWEGTPVRVRALILDRVADELEKVRPELTALMVLDAGKRVEEADIEVSEAVDFARYYARQLLELSERFELRPHGPTVVTPPWNFPLAIPLGSCLAALATGCPVILKPAPETPLVARAGLDACHRAGVPRDALQFLPCADEIASLLITDRRVKQVVLTGATSTARLFLRMRPALRLIAETGGKNAAFVADLSDREGAIAHIVQSAFGHAGQKCSALSVLVLEEGVYQDAHFRESLVDAARSLPVGSAWDPFSVVTPLIRPPEGPLSRILREGEAGASWALVPTVAADNDALVSPGILWGIEPGGFAHQTEFFGPVLSVLGARDLDHGLDLMNATPYGLTAGFFGLSEHEQMKFLSHMNAGNLYVNRGVTGAVVGRQPFGGRKASSVGAGKKAGGPGYLPQFCQLTRRPAVTLSVASVLADVAGTTTVGEENFLRYQPASCVLFVGEGASEEDIGASLTAARLAGAEVVVHHSTEPDLASRLSEAGTTRVRVLGQCGPTLEKLTEELGLSLLFDPVSPEPGIEVRHYLLEQSVSIAYHRHGNVSLRGLHPLLLGRTPARHGKTMA